MISFHCDLVESLQAMQSPRRCASQHLPNLFDQPSILMEHCLAYEKNYPFLTIAHKPLQEPPMAYVSVLFHHFQCSPMFHKQQNRDSSNFWDRLHSMPILALQFVLLGLLPAFSHRSKLYFSFMFLFPLWRLYLLYHPYYPFFFFYYIIIISAMCLH